MDIKIYSSPGCFYCEKAIELCDRAGVEYKKIIVGGDITLQEFQVLFPNVSQYPHVTIDDKVIGGLVPFAKYFITEGLVSARKD